MVVTAHTGVELLLPQTCTATAFAFGAATASPGLRASRITHHTSYLCLPPSRYRHPLTVAAAATPSADSASPARPRHPPSLDARHLSSLGLTGYPLSPALLRASRLGPFVVYGPLHQPHYRVTHSDV